MATEFKQGSLEVYLLGVEDSGELNGLGLVGCSHFWESLLGWAGQYWLLV